MTEASLLPTVNYSSVHTGAPERAMRFIGTLESIQGDRTMWVRGSDLTLAVDVGSSEVYVLEQGESDRPAVPPLRTSWSRVGSLPAGAKVLVSGRLDSYGSHPVLTAWEGEPVLVVFYDGPDATLVRRCIWGGRQLNEYWNSVTPGALAGGTLVLVIIAYLLLRQPTLIIHARLAIGLALVPVLPLLPPGVVAFYAYRVLWRRGRRLRAHRDILQVPVRHFSGDEQCARLADGESYCRSVVDLPALSPLVTQGLTILTPPIESGTSHYTLFGAPGAEHLVAPNDPLSEWIAIRGEPDDSSERCQRGARRYEIASLVILGAGLLVNLSAAMIALAIIV